MAWASDDADPIQRQRSREVSLKTLRTPRARCYGQDMTTADRMSVDLSPQAARIVRDAVQSGEYPDARAAVEAALQGWSAKRDHLFGYAPEELDQLIDEGVASGPGREVDFESIKREARRRAGAPYEGA